MNEVSKNASARLVHARLYYLASGSEEGAVRNRLAFAGFSLVLIFTLGSLGYYAIGQGRWSLEDCVYMVLITVTSVGYAEVLPVSQTGEGRLFTMGLLVLGMGVSFYFLSSLTAFIIEGDLREVLWRRRMERRLKGLSGHYIICGGGRTGKHVTEELLHDQADLVVVERDEADLDRMMREFGDRIIAMVGDATEDGVLKEAGVERAKGLVSTLPLDQDNLFVALSARQLNPKLRIVSRASAENVAPKLKQAGSDAVVSPVDIGGRRLAHELLRPNVVGFLDVMSRDITRKLDIEEMKLPPDSPLHGRTLANSGIRKVTNALVLAVFDGEDVTYNPPPDLELRGNMTLVVLGERDEIERLRTHAGASVE